MVSVLTEQQCNRQEDEARRVHHRGHVVPTSRPAEPSPKFGRKKIPNSKCSQHTPTPVSPPVRLTALHSGVSTSSVPLRWRGGSIPRRRGMMVRRRWVPENQTIPDCCDRTVQITYRCLFFAFFLLLNFISELRLVSYETFPINHQNNGSDNWLRIQL